MAHRDKQNLQQRKLELLNEMSQHRENISVKKQSLFQQIDKSKNELKDNFVDKINVQKMLSNKVKTSFSSSPTKWFLGSALGGIVVSKIFFGSVGRVSGGSKKKSSVNEDSSQVSKGIFMTLAGLAIRPMVKSFLLGKARAYVSNRFFAQQSVQSQQLPYQGEDAYHSSYYDVN